MSTEGFNGVAGGSATGIRTLEAGDLPALRAVIDANDLFPGEMLDGMAEAHLRGDGGELWFTAVDGVPVGLAYCAPERMTEGTWNLLLIAVRPDLHGAGVGSSLMARVEGELASLGARVLLVETSGLPGFARTRGFYVARGYDEEARIREFYQAGEDKVVFRKAIGTKAPLDAG